MNDFEEFNVTPELTLDPFQEEKKRDSADLSGGRTGNTGDCPDTGRKEYGQCICRKKLISPIRT